MGLQLDLNKSVEDNLRLTSGGKRKRRGGNGEKDKEIEAARPAAEYAITKVLKTAYDRVVKPTASAVTQAAVAAALVYAVDASFRSDLCDPLAKSAASTMSMVPMAAAYVSKCDNAMTMYHSAVTSTILLVSPLLVSAIKTAGSIFVSDETIDSVAAELVDAAKNPAQAAAKALAAKKKVAELEDDDSASAAPTTAATGVFSYSRRRGGKKSKKRTTKKRRVTRRKLTFSY